jgi:hypothetical protein
MKWQESRENWTVRSWKLVFIAKIIGMNKKKDEMGGWMGHVACVRKMKSAYKFWLERLKVQDHLEDLGQG